MREGLSEYAPFLSEKEITLAHSNVHKVGGVEFEITTDQASQLEYVQEILGNESAPVEEPSNKRIQIIGLTGPSDVFPTNVSAAREVIISNSNFEHGKIDERTSYTTSRFGFTNITIEEPDMITHICIGSRPEMGIASFIKTELLKHYASMKSPMLVFHGGSIVQKNTSRTSVFTGVESVNAYGNRCGKTTAVLASALRNDSDFSLVSNDEVIMQLTQDGLVQLPFPNQIPIRKGTLDAVLKDNIRIQVDLNVDKDGETGELIYSTNSGLIQKSGFETAIPEGKTIENWFFTNLSPDQGKTVAVEANSDQSKQLFTASIFARRMNQARDKGYLGELHRAYDVLPEETMLAEQMYERLVSDGTKFWMLTGGTDRKQIYDAVRAVARP